VLVADDSAISRHVTALMLKRLGVPAVDTVGDGEVAMAKVLAIDYAAVFLDLNMPRLRGDQVARSLRSLLATVPPLIVVSNDT
jgi:CheY-like chemotaxis protein